MARITKARVCNLVCWACFFSFIAFLILGAFGIDADLLAAPVISGYLLARWFYPD